MSGANRAPDAAPWQKLGQNHIVGGFAPLLGPLAPVRSLAEIALALPWERRLADKVEFDNV